MTTRRFERVITSADMKDATFASAGPLEGEKHVGRYLTLVNGGTTDATITFYITNTTGNFFIEVFTLTAGAGVERRPHHVVNFRDEWFVVVSGADPSVTAILTVLVISGV